MNSIKSIILAASISCLITHVSGQGPFSELVSGDTLIAGELNEMLFLKTQSDSVNPLFVKAVLTPLGYIDRDLCRNCNEDTIFVEQVLAVNDTLVSMTFNIPHGTYPTRYKLNYWGNYYGSYESIRIVSKPYVVDLPESTTNCFGDQVLFEFTAYEPEALVYQWYHNDELLNGKKDRQLFLQDIKMADTGYYYCVLSNQWGVDTAGIASLSIYPYAEEIGLPEGPEKMCKGTLSSTYQLPENSLVDYYNWIVIPDEAGVLHMNHNILEINWNEDFVGEVLIYAETMSEQCIGPNTDTLSVRLSGPQMVPEICIVGLDESSNKHRIIWNKIPDESIVAYNIYSESNQAGIYLKLKTVSTEEMSVYVDSLSFPDEVSHSYRISYIDTCNLESELSIIHRTVHLSANIGTSGENNLNWSSYDGFAFLSYEVFRGSHPDSLYSIQEVSSNITSLTDRYPPVGNVYYQIAVSRNGKCQPEKKASNDYSNARSNIIEFKSSGLQSVTNDYSFGLFPNPASNLVTITTSGLTYDDAVISVYSVMGIQIAIYEMKGNTITIPTGNLREGIYLIKLSSREIETIKRIAITR